MLTRPGQTLSWDAENRLVQVVSATITTTMGYDGDGKRVTLADANGVTLFVEPALRGLCSGLSNGANDHQHGVPDPDRHGPAARGGRVLARYGRRAGPSHQVLLRRWQANRHAGRERRRADVPVSGPPWQHHGQQRRGERRVFPVRGYAVRRRGDGVPVHGQRNDGGTELYYYGARYYDPVAGRFISADTIVPSVGNPQDLSRYSYTVTTVRYRDTSDTRTASMWIAKSCKRPAADRCISHGLLAAAYSARRELAESKTCMPCRRADVDASAFDRGSRNYRH